MARGTFFSMFNKAFKVPLVETSNGEICMCTLKSKDFFPYALKIDSLADQISRSWCRGSEASKYANSSEEQNFDCSLINCGRSFSISTPIAFSGCSPHNTWLEL